MLQMSEGGLIGMRALCAVFTGIVPSQRHGVGKY